MSMCCCIVCQALEIEVWTALAKGLFTTQYARHLALSSVLEGSSCCYCPWDVLTDEESDAQRHWGHLQARWARKGQSQKSVKGRLF